MTPTKAVADKIVMEFTNQLTNLQKEYLPEIKSIFICGSYIRGDWIDKSSDLDINILYSELPGDASSQNTQLVLIKSLIQNISGQKTFDSQIPGGIDWGTLPFLPQTESDVSTPTPYIYFSGFYFDFLKNINVIWGEDFRNTLPKGPNPSGLTIPMIEAFLNRMASLSELSDDQRKAAFLAYKGALLAQIRFGEATIDKREVLQLYRVNVPDGQWKEIGEDIIQCYLTARYPENPPKYKTVGYYRRFLTGILDCMRRK